MIYHVTGASEPRLFDEAARLARMDRSSPAPRAPESRPDHSREVARILEACVHPVRDYLKSLARDGTPRLDTWAMAYLGVQDTTLNRAMASLWLVAAVAQIMQSGITC